MRPHPFVIIAIVGALLGLLFAGVSTFDFAQHLDRQVHSIHCSFIPGLSGGGGAESGCQVTMMSPYSSVLRAKLWGGVPISLPAMGVFAFLLFLAVDLVLSRRQTNARATAFFAVGTLLPLVTSMVMAYIAFANLGAACKLCIGIYISSALVSIGAWGLWFRARKHPQAAVITSKPKPKKKKRPKSRQEGDDPAWVAASDASEREDDSEVVELHTKSKPADSIPHWVFAAVFGIGVVFVLGSVGSYVVAAPDHSRYIGACGSLTNKKDDYGIMVGLGGDSKGAETIEILDPLCPACRAFEERLESSGLQNRFNRKAILFPLDNTCNWMVNEAIHPGACAVSEAVLCAGDDSDKVIEWAFANQEEIRTKTKAEPTAAAKMVAEQFPDLASCVGGTEVKQKLNQSLRWAVGNNVRVLTPQLYVDGVKLCDEDVDLGLEFALSEMLARHDRGDLKALTPEAEQPAPPSEPPTAAEPAVKPDQPAATPDEPAATPAEPAAKPDEPAAEADEPAAKPDEPAAKPDEPAAKPDEPAAKPDEPAAKPDEPAAKPDEPAAKPDEPAAKPDEPAPKPDEPAASEGSE